MNCNNCPHYRSYGTSNQCLYTGAENFSNITDECKLVDDEGKPTRLGYNLFGNTPQEKRDDFI